METITQPRNDFAENALLGLAMTDPTFTIPEALKRGLKSSHFGWKATQIIWSTIVDLHERGAIVDPILVVTALRDTGKLEQAGGQELIDRVTENVLSSPINAKVYIQNIIDVALRRQQKQIAVEIRAIADNLDESAQAIPGTAMSKLEGVAAQYTRMRNPLVGNPADGLAVSKGWHTTTGLDFLDCVVRFTSEDVHFLAGDPGSGKSTLCIHMAAHNALAGIPTVIISAETDELEIQLSMLTMTREVSASFVSKVRYDHLARTEANLQKIRDLWDKHYGDCPLRIHKVDGGANEVVSIISSITEPSLVIVDHAYAVIAQTEVSQGMKEHQQFVQFFARVLISTKRNNHITVMLNQYTKAGRNEVKRGPDAQYGGSGVQNIAATMIHIWNPASEYTAASVGYRAVSGEIVKCRARLLVDDNGNMIDPLKRPLSFYIENRYRLAVSKLPVAILPSAES